MLVVTFDSPSTLYRAARALADLNEANEIAVNSAVAVAKDSSGAVSTEKTQLEHPEATMGGTAIGTLVGLLGGLAGAAVGATGGFLLGSMSDWFRARITADFVAETTDSIEPGKAALIAQIDEDDNAAVDARMSELGGVVRRYALEDVTDDETRKESNAIRDRFHEFSRQHFH